MPTSGQQCVAVSLASAVECFAIKIFRCLHHTIVSWVFGTTEVERAANAVSVLQLADDFEPLVVLLEVGTLAQDIHAMPGSGQSYDEAILDGTEAEDVLGVASDQG